MKKNLLKIFSTAALACLGAAIGVCASNKTVTAGAVTPSAEGSHAFYQSATLAEELGGESFTWLDSSNAVMTHNGKKIRGTLNLDVRSDSTFYENAGSLGATPSGTTWHQVYGYPEVYVSGIPGAVTTGFECAFAQDISVADSNYITFEIGIQPQDNNPEKFRGDSKPFPAYVYLYGDDGTDEVQTLVKTLSFGIGFFTTAVLDLSQTELVSVSRMAIAVDFTAYNQADESKGEVNLGSAGDMLVIANINAHAKQNVTAEKTFSANENDVYFFNGGCLAGVMDEYAIKKVYRTNGPQVWFGVGGIPNSDYKYSTPRIRVGHYVIMCFREPIRVADYAFLDARMMIWPQGVDASLPNILQETATDYTLTALRVDATGVESGYAIHFARSTWQTCRIPLAPFADEDGYVTKILLHYTDNDGYGHQSDDQSRYNVNFAMYNATATNYEETELVVTYITAPMKDSEQGTYTFNLKSSIEFTHGEVMSEAFQLAVKINGETLRDLIADGRASVRLSGYFIKITVAQSVMKLDDTDSVEIEQGVTVRGNVQTVDNEKFVYSSSLRRFELVPDRAAFDGVETGIGIEVVELGNPNAFDFFDAGQMPCNSIWVSFNGTATTMGLGVAHQSLEELAQSSGNTDMYNYHLAKLGVYESVMDYVYVNGKTLREWMVIDRMAGRAGYIRVIFMGFGFNTGKSFVIQAATGSALELGMGRDMSIEFKKGFTTSMAQRFQHDIKYEISAEKAVGVNSLFSATANQYPVEADKGCNGNISVLLPTTAFVAAIATAFVLRRNGKKENVQ